jgi:1-acyl-sn-glycerol-3-phosphate acyltransferase
MKRVKRWLADWLLMRSLQTFFRGVYLHELAPLEPGRPAIVFANHGYWWDGHFLYLLSQEWRPGNSMVWMKELAPFPPFEALGAMPFPEDEAAVRAATIRRTVRALRSSPAALFLFPEGDINTGRSLGPFSRSLHWLHKKVPEAGLIPVAIRILQGIHQYPEAYILSGEPFTCTAEEEEWLRQARKAVCELREWLDRRVAAGPDEFRCIMPGRVSVDESPFYGGNTRGPKPRHYRDIE